MPLVSAVYHHHDLLRHVAARSNSGSKNGGQWAQYSGGRATMMTPNYCGGGRKVLILSQEFQSSTVQSTFASERPQIRTYGRQTCFLPWAPSNFVSPLAVIQYSSALPMYMK